MTLLPLHHRSLFALLMLASTAAVPMVGLAEEPSRIQISGRVVDRAGVPLPNSWVVTQGSRRTGTLAGFGGRYLLEVPAGTMTEIGRVPLLLRVQARRKGWRMTLPGGAPELAIQLSVVTDSLGAVRFQVRSSDPAVAAMLADEAVLRTGTRVALKLDFVGVRGTQDENPVVDMTALREVVLSPPIRVVSNTVGAVGHVSPPAVAARAPEQAAAGIQDGASDRKGSSERKVPSASPIAMLTEPLPPREDRMNPVSRTRTDSLREARSRARGGRVPPDSEAEPRVARATKEVAPKGAASRPVSRAAHAPDDEIIVPAEPAPPPAPAKAESVPSSRTAVTPPSSPAVETPASKPPVETRASKPSGDARSPIPITEAQPAKERPRRVVRPGEPEDAAVPTADELTRDDIRRKTVFRPGDPEAQAADQERRAKKKPRARPATAEEIRRALDAMGEAELAEVHSAGAQGLPSEGGAKAAGAGSTTNPTGAPVPGPSANTPPAVVPTLAPAPSAPAPSAATPSGAASEPSAMSTGPAFTAPAGGASSAPAAVADTNAPCQCRIQGTVEVVADRPLPARMQVFVYLEDDHKVGDTVELFMGSPRQFELLGVPCGPHKLKVRVRSKLKFVLTTPEPSVDCTGGGYRQLKIALEPVQRWRASR